MRKYWKVFLLVAIGAAAAACLTFLFVKKAYDGKNSSGSAQNSNEAGIFAVKKETLNLWYTDDNLTDYLNSVAVSYNSKHNDIRVVPKLESGKDYLKMISDASVKNTDMPDMYIISNDTLEQATLAGLTSEVYLANAAKFSAKDPEVAVDAVTYSGKIVGYPLYYETSSLLYNKTYLDDWAKSQIEQAQDESEGAAAQETADAEAAAAETATADTGNKSGEAAGTDKTVGNSAATETDTAGTDETTTETTTEKISADEQSKIDAKAAETLPKTITDIETFADTYDAPEEMQSILKWDVTDIFYNYFFIGASVDVGGKCGDDGNVNIYNANSIRSLLLYQKLNQFFSIDTSEISYSGVLQDFIDGKILYTVATTDAVAAINKAKDEGKCSYDYGVTLLPSINKDLPAKSMSVTNAVIVNGYCANKDAANEFAQYLTEQPAQEFYDRTGKVSVQKDAKYTQAGLDAFMNEYERSAPVPKMISTSNYWVKLEIAFSKIWDGADPNDTLHALSEEIMTQVKGSKYTQDKIEVQETTEETDSTNEYVDDSAAVTSSGDDNQ